MERFDPDLLDDEWPFEIDHQAAHLFKHPYLGIQNIAEVDGKVLMVALAPSRNDATKCRPIGCYLASVRLAQRYKEDR